MGEIEDGQVSTAVEETPASAALDPPVDNKKPEEASKEDEGETVAQEAARAVNETSDSNENGEVANSKPQEEPKAQEEVKPETQVANSSSGKKRPAYVYDPDKITLRFLFANRDGLSVMVKCDPADTVGEVKGALLSVWPEELPGCSGGDSLRLICMGKGILMPDSRTLEDFQVPVFRTHPTPVNVAVRPDKVAVESKKPSGGSSNQNSNTAGNRGSGNANVTSQGCACVIL